MIPSAPTLQSAKPGVPQSNDAFPIVARQPPAKPDSPPAETTKKFVERRRRNTVSDKPERRQFGSSHWDLSDEGRQLAVAIDQYKIDHHRRYLTCDELLGVITRLGYARNESVE